MRARWTQDWTRQTFKLFVTHNETRAGHCICTCSAACLVFAFIHVWPYCAENDSYEDKFGLTPSRGLNQSQRIQRGGFRMLRASPRRAIKKKSLGFIFKLFILQLESSGRAASSVRLGFHDPEGKVTTLEALAVRGLVRYKRDIEENRT